jgi:adenylate cyclase
MELRRACSRLRLEPRMFDLLRYLLDHRDRVVKKEELFEVVWDGTAVCDGALTQCVSVLRKALGDTGRTQRMLRTYPRVGYRFVGRVEPRGAGVECDGTAQAS